MRPADRLADIVECGRFSAAGRRLSKAAVSKAAARLEPHLGERQLNRSTRRVRPTEAGLACCE